MVCLSTPLRNEEFVVATVHEVTESLRGMVEELSAQGIEKLASERELALSFEASRTTIRRALAELQAQGLIARGLGRSGGSFITNVENKIAGFSASLTSVPSSDHSERKFSRSLNSVNGIPQMLQEQGFKDGTKVISASIELASERIAEDLQISVADPIVTLLRLRFADEKPLSLERMHLSLARFPDLLEQKLDAVYGLLASNYGVNICRADETIEAGSAPRTSAYFLAIAVRTPALVVTRIAYDDQDRPVETSVDLFRMDRTRLTVSTLNPRERDSSSLRQDF